MREIELAMTTERLENQRIRDVDGRGVDVHWTDEFTTRLQTILGCVSPFLGCEISVNLVEVSVAITAVIAKVTVMSPLDPSLAQTVADAAAFFASDLSVAGPLLKVPLFTVTAEVTMQGTVQTPVGHTAVGSSLLNDASKFAHTLRLDSFMPTEGSFGGGTRIVLRGDGFPSKAVKAHVQLGRQGSL